MKPRIHVITLAVADLDRALAFYRDGLGFRTEGLIGTEFKGDETIPDGTPAVFHLHGGLMLSIYLRSELAKDAVVPLIAAKPGEFSIGHAVASRAEVDEVIAQAKAAGAAVTDSPHDRQWGIYSGYFQDPDGHHGRSSGTPRSTSPRPEWPPPKRGIDLGPSLSEQSEMICTRPYLVPTPTLTAPSRRAKMLSRGSHRSGFGRALTWRNKLRRLSAWLALVHLITHAGISKVASPGGRAGEKIRRTWREDRQSCGSARRCGHRRGRPWL